MIPETQSALIPTTLDESEPQSAPDPGQIYPSSTTTISHDSNSISKLLIRRPALTLHVRSTESACRAPHCNSCSTDPSLRTESFVLNSSTEQYISNGFSATSLPFQHLRASRRGGVLQLYEHKPPALHIQHARRYRRATHAHAGTS